MFLKFCNAARVAPLYIVPCSHNFQTRLAVAQQDNDEIYRECQKFWSGMKHSINLTKLTSLYINERLLKPNASDVMRLETGHNMIRVKNVHRFKRGFIRYIYIYENILPKITFKNSHSNQHL